MTLDELILLFYHISQARGILMSARLGLLVCFILQTGLRIGDVMPLTWDRIELQSEEGAPDRTVLSIPFTNQKMQKPGTTRWIRLRRHLDPTRCAVGALALQMAYLLDIRHYSGKNFP